MNSEPSNFGTAQVQIKPDLCLAVGITGHRQKRLQNTDMAAVREAITALLLRVRQSAQDVATHHPTHFATTVPKMRLVSALADGADTVTAEAALSSGWRLDVCLPFNRDEYATDFAEGESRKTFERLLTKASATFALTGKRADANAAYEAAGHVMLDQVDVLLALWDGDAGRGRGGTARIVAEAISRHIPVIHIDIHSRNTPVLLWSGLADFEIEQPTIDNVPRAEAASALEPVVAALCVPPDNPVDRRMLARFYKERSRSRTPALPYPTLSFAASFSAIQS